MFHSKANFVCGPMYQQSFQYGPLKKCLPTPDFHDFSLI